MMRSGEAPELSATSTPNLHPYIHQFVARDSQKDDIKEMSHSDMTRSVERSRRMGILPKEARSCANGPP